MTTEVRTFLDVCADLWRARLPVFVGAAIGGLAAAAFLFTANPYYKASMIISPANPMNGAEVSSLLADDNLFALRYLVQRVGVANSSDFLRFENTYAGASVAELLLKDENITDGLSAESSFTFTDPVLFWNAEKLAEYIADRVRLEPVGASGLRRMVYLHPDRAFGIYFLRRLHKVSDELIRTKLGQEATQRVRYLQRAIDTTENPEHRRALTTLLLEQERLRMLVSIESPYAAAIVEPPSSAVKQAWPSAALAVPGFVFAGALIGFVFYGFGLGARQESAGGQSRTARRWVNTDSGNTNEPQERPLTKRDAA